MEKTGYEEVCAGAGNNAALIKGHGSWQGDPVIVVIYQAPISKLKRHEALSPFYSGNRHQMLGGTQKGTWS